MITVKLSAAVLGGIVSIYCFIPYLRDIFARKTEPHSYTWFIFSLLQGITMVVMFGSNAGLGLVTVVIGFLLSSFIFFLSLKYGTKYITFFDTVCLIGALVAIAMYLFLHDPLLSIILVCVIDAVGFIPTFRKSWIEPETETASFFILSALASVFCVVALSNYSLVNVLYPATLMLTEPACTFVILFRRKKKRMQKYAFVDRDGTFLFEPDAGPEADPRSTFPLKSLDDFAFMDGTLEGLKMLVDKGYRLVLVTNQAYLGTPAYPREVYNEVTERMTRKLKTSGVHFDFTMMCPHGPDDGCDCRKPKIGGLKEFLKKNKGRIDFAHSLMFGDRDTDRQFAENLGVRFVKIERNTRFKLPEDI